MRKHGIKFGAYHIYLPQSLKPAPRELAIILFALKHGGIRQAGVSELPQIVLSGRTSFLIDPEVDARLYEVAGFKVAGKRAVRIDILERLADIIRPLIAFDPKKSQTVPPAGAAEGNGFRVTVEMTSLLGCSGEDFASILQSLGYRLRRTPKPLIPPETAAPAAGLTAAADIGDLATLDDAPPAEMAIEAAAAEAEETADLAAGALLDGATPPTDSEAAATVEGAPIAVEPTLVEAAADLGSGPWPAHTAGVPPVDAADAKPAEPEFDEVWFPGGRRHDHHHHDSRREPARPARRHDAPVAASAPAADGATPEAAADGAAERPRHHHRRPHGDRQPRPEGNAEARGPRPAGKGNARPPLDSGRADRRDARRPEPGGPREDRKPFDTSKSFDKKKSFGKGADPRPPREPAYDPDSPFAALAALRNRKPE